MLFVICIYVCLSPPENPSVDWKLLVKYCFANIGKGKTSKKMD